MRPILLILALALLLYATGVGISGFSHSEGLRVYPAYAMLDSGDWLVSRLFEQVYLRKPPLMLWMVAISSELLGRTEFAARFVSVLSIALSAVATHVFLARRLSPSWGLVGAVLFLLTPWFWYPGRSAEIESLHNFCTLWACLLVLGRALPAPLDLPHPPASLPARTLFALLLALATSAMLLAKGPAGVPVLAAACVVALAYAPRPRRLALFADVVIALVLGVLVFLLWLLAVKFAVRAGNLTPVVQAPTGFLFKAGDIPQILALPFAALVAALPASIALLWPARRSSPAPNTPGFEPRARLAPALTACVLLAILIYMLAGVSNNRYAQPAATLLPAAAAAIAWWWWHRAVALGPVIARVKHTRLRVIAAVLLALLMPGAAAHNTWQELRRRDITSGKPPAHALARALANLPDPALRAAPVDLFADELLDHRPEVVYELTRAARDAGIIIRPRWTPLSLAPADQPPMPHPGGLLLLRTDTRGLPPGAEREPHIYDRLGLLRDFDVVAVVQIHKDNFQGTLFRRRAAPAATHTAQPQPALQPAQ